MASPSTRDTRGIKFSDRDAASRHAQQQAGAHGPGAGAGAATGGGGGGRRGAGGGAAAAGAVPVVGWDAVVTVERGGRDVSRGGAGDLRERLTASASQNQGREREGGRDAGSGHGSLLGRKSGEGNSSSPREGREGEHRPRVRERLSVVPKPGGDGQQGSIRDRLGPRGQDWEGRELRREEEKERERERRAERRYERGDERSDEGGRPKGRGRSHSRSRSRSPGARRGGRGAPQSTSDMKAGDWMCPDPS